MSGIEMGDPTGRVLGTRYVIVRPNKHGFGIDVGWGIFDRDGVFCHLWWGNTRNRASLSALMDDCRARGTAFEPPTEAELGRLTAAWEGR
jgi:hypothetical protein